MKKVLMLCMTAGLLITSVESIAQEKVKYSKEDLKIMDDDLFDEVFVGVSSKKIATVILKDGTKLEGTATNLKRKKGQIYSIDIKVGSGKKQTYESDVISEMYLPISGMAKASKVSKYFGNVNNFGRKSLKDSANPDEVFVKNVKASLKNKKDEQEFLMQLINPEFSSLIEVYADPNAKETGGISFGGGPAISGGVTKSYYIKKGDQVIWLRKSDFEDQYNFLFGDNQEFMKQFPYNSIKWDHLSYLIYQYTKLAS